MSFGGGFERGFNIASRARARRAQAARQEQELKLRNAQDRRDRVNKLVQLRVDNPNVAAGDLALLLNFDPSDPLVRQADATAKIMINAQKNREEAEKRGEVFTPGIQDPQTGQPGSAALLGATAQTPQDRSAFSGFVEGIQQLPPEQRVQQTNRLAAAIQGVPAALQGRSLEAGFQTGLDVPRETALARAREGVQEEFEQRRTQRERAGLGIPSQEIRDVEIAFNRGDIDRQQRDTNIRALLRKRAQGEALTAEIGKIDSGQQAAFGTIADIEIANAALEKVLDLPVDQLSRFVGIRGRVGRAVTGFTGAATDFLQEFQPEDRAEVENWMREQFAAATDLGVADESVAEEIRDTGFMLNREALGSIDSLLLASQIALARSNTRGGRLTRVALDQAKDTINANRFSTAESTIAAFRETSEIMKRRAAVLTRQLESQIGSKARAAAQGLREEAALLSRNPIQISDERVGQLAAEETRTAIETRARENLSDEGSSVIEQLQKRRQDAEGAQEEGGGSAFNVTPQTIQSALEATGLPGGGKNPTDAQSRLFTQTRTAAERRFTQDPSSVSTHELVLVLTNPRFADRAEAEIRRRGGRLEGL